MKWHFTQHKQTWAYNFVPLAKSMLQTISSKFSISSHFSCNSSLLILPQSFVYSKFSLISFILPTRSIVFAARASSSLHEIHRVELITYVTITIHILKFELPRQYYL